MALSHDDTASLNGNTIDLYLRKFTKSQWSYEIMMHLDGHNLYPVGAITICGAWSVIVVYTGYIHLGFFLFIFLFFKKEWMHSAGTPEPLLLDNAIRRNSYTMCCPPVHREYQVRVFLFKFTRQGFENAC